MIKIYFGSFVLLTAGLLFGIFLSGDSTESVAVTSYEDAYEDTVTTQHGNLTDYQARARIVELEAELASLSARLNLIESRDIADDEVTEADTGPSAEVRVFDGRNEPVAIVQGLIAAGLDTFDAEQLARRVSESQLKQLELRDTAVREGYIGSEQYRQEMAAAREAQTRIRDEVDASTYDKYLYFSGQSNRVAVSSVMLGSAAENSGLQTGDVLLRYEEDALYKPGDLRGLTTQGEKDELVDLTLLRDGGQMTVSIPRGPLGVRLSAVRIHPDDN